MFHVNLPREKLEDMLSKLNSTAEEDSDGIKFKTETTEYGITKISNIGKKVEEEINPNTGKTRTQMMDRANYLIKDIELNKSILQKIKNTSSDLVEAIERNSKAIAKQEEELNELFKYVP